jgi:hypothetical protein
MLEEGIWVAVAGVDASKSAAAFTTVGDLRSKSRSISHLSRWWVFSF